MKETALLIASKYFGASISRKNKSSIGFIRILTYLAISGVAVGTAALLIVLSVFNGLEEFTLSLFNTSNAELKVQPKVGKSFSLSDSTIEALSQLGQVRALTRVCSDNALAKYGDSESIIVEVKGMDFNFLEQYPLDTALVEGSADLKKGALIGIGVMYRLGANLKNEFNALQLWYPRYESQVLLDPTRSFRKMAIPIGAVLALEQSFDEKMVLVPLRFMQALMDLDSTQYTAIEIKAKSDPKKLKKQVAALLGEKFDVLDRIEQQTTILNAIRIERLFVFAAFVFIISIAAFNIFFSLAMLSIEKKRDTGIMYAIGADSGLLKRVYLYLGLMIGGAGVSLGALFGFGLCLLQQHFGLVKLSTSETIIQSYPIKMAVGDFVWVSLAVFVITLVSSFYPAKNASLYQNINLK